MSGHGEYLGEEDVTSEYNFSKEELVRKFLERFKGIDGGHHKEWLLDQIARIINGSSVAIKKAKWEDGHTELRFRVGESEQYRDWVKKMKAGEDGPDTYFYEEGVAP